MDQPRILQIDNRRSCAETDGASALPGEDGAAEHRDLLEDQSAYFLIAQLTGRSLYVRCMITSYHL